MNTFSFIPAILNIFFKTKTTDFDNRFELFCQKWLEKSIKIKFEIVINLSAFLTLAAVFGLIFLPELSLTQAWEVCISIIFVSISYWENFLDACFIGYGKVKNETILNLKKSIENSRHRTLLFTVLWKIAIIFMFTYMDHPQLFMNMHVLFEENESCFFILVTHTISSFLCYYLSLIACKLCMQRTSFALPLAAVFPISLTLVLSFCQYLPKDSFLKKDFLLWTCAKNYASPSLGWITFCGVLWWISHLWVNRHIWSNVTERSAQTRRSGSLSCFFCV